MKQLKIAGVEEIPGTGSRLRVLVCGGRDYDDTEELWAALDRLHAASPISALMEGGADGADGIGRLWAGSNDVPVLTFIAEWRRFGRAAGPKRNATMLRVGKPDLVVATRGGKGTADMVRRARVARLRIMHVP